MKCTGVVRKLDELGRITLPIELRRNLGVGDKDPLEIFVDEDTILLKSTIRQTSLPGKWMISLNTKERKYPGHRSCG